MTTKIAKETYTYYSLNYAETKARAKTSVEGKLETLSKGVKVAATAALETLQNFFRILANIGLGIANTAIKGYNKLTGRVSEAVVFQAECARLAILADFVPEAQPVDEAFRAETTRLARLTNLEFERKPSPEEKESARLAGLSDLRLMGDFKLKAPKKVTKVAPKVPTAPAAPTGFRAYVNSGLQKVADFYNSMHEALADAARLNEAG